MSTEEATGNVPALTLFAENSGDPPVSPAVGISVPAKTPPAWVIIGWPRPDGGYSLAASATLTTADLRARYESDHSEGFMKAAKPVNKKLALSAVMDDVLFVQGDSFDDALDGLRRVWPRGEQGTTPPVSLPAGEQG